MSKFLGNMIHLWKPKTKDPFGCARRGDVDFFKTVDPDILLKARNRRDESVLTVAAKKGHLDCCEVIVERCTPLLYHQSGIIRWSVLHNVAASSGKNLENIMRFLITADSEADLEDGVGGKIPNKRLLTMQEERGRTALHLAVEFGNLVVAQFLLEAYHSNDLLAAVDSHQQTALHIAVKRGKLDMVKLICEADLDIQLLSMPDSQGSTSLHSAVTDCNLEIVRFLIEAYNQTPLLLAMDKAATASDEARSVSEDICKLLLEKDPSQCTRRTGDMGWTPLHRAASYGLNSVVKDIIRLCPDCINTVDFHGQNFLHIAFTHGHPNAVKHFLESKDRDVVTLLDTRDKDGNMPLHLAVSNGNVEVVGLILEAHPISACIANISQQTPYVMAMEKILSDEYDEAHSESDSKIIRILLEKDPKQCKILTGDMHWTYLHRAASCGHLSIIKDIIELCPDCLKLEDTHKQTFIHIAAKHGFINVLLTKDKKQHCAYFMMPK